MQVAAIFEKGIFKPLDKIDIDEYQEVIPDVISVQHNRKSSIERFIKYAEDNSVIVDSLNIPNRDERNAR